jgi:hypothetical protein
MYDMKREQAIGKSAVLQKQIYELGIKAQTLVKDIQDETETFLTEKDFATIDFKKVITLSFECRKIQKEFSDKAATLKNLVDTFNITEL